MRWSSQSLEDCDADQQLERRAKARNPFNLVGSVILVLIALSIVRMIQIKIGYMLSNGKTMINICTDDGSVRYITDFKDVRMTFHLFFMSQNIWVFSSAVFNFLYAL